MRTAEQVEALRAQMAAEGAGKPEIIRQVALACIGWPYVFGAWGEECKPANRRRRVRSDHPTIASKCPAISREVACSPQACPWGIGVRMYDCRGFTRWLMQQVGLDIVNSKGQACQTVTNQYNAAGNWQRRGKIGEMPDCVCNVFDLKHGHTGMHIGGGVVVDCSVNVRVVGMTGWTHYAVHKGLYSEGEIPMETIKPTLRKGSRGDLVRELQEALNALGFDCGAADGIFGTKTFNAVVAFQTEAKLDADGVVGPKTWRELDAARTSSGADAPPSPEGEGREVTYRVTIEGVTWAQYKEILKTWPLAEVVKEG